MKNAAELIQSDFIDLLTYSKITGKSSWEEREECWFDAKRYSAKRAQRIWNTKNAGKEITHLDSHGYIAPKILGISFLLHRVIWIRETGEWPKGDIDHINGNIVDNRWENLRDVTHSDNLRNQKLSIANSSGATGVYFDLRTSKWVSQISIGKKTYFLGRFSTFEEAVIARKAAETKYGFGPNHGRI